MAYKYIGQDSGRVLINGLTLKPGVVYEISDGDVRYAPGVNLIKKPLAEKLLSSKLIEEIPAEVKQPAKAESKAAVAPVEKVEKAA